MRRSVALTAAVVLSAAGFAVASIMASGSLGALNDVTNTLTVVATNTVTVVTTVVSGTATTTSTTPSRGRGIVICGRFGRGHRFNTRIVAQGNLRSYLRGGGHIGACVVIRRIRPGRGLTGWGWGYNGFGFGASGGRGGR
jgi:hypothetical protein